MATNTSKKKIGRMWCEGQRCPSHEMNKRVVVYENDKGTLSYRCDECDRTPYAKFGTGQHNEWIAEMTLLEKKAPDKPPSAPPQPAASVASVVPSTEETTAAPPAQVKTPEPAPAKKGGFSWIP